jgi:hypothetical protein
VSEGWIERSDIMTKVIEEVVKAICSGPPPLRVGEVIDRRQATDLTWFAYGAPYFAKINDATIDALARYVKRKAKKRRFKWCLVSEGDREETYIESVGRYSVFIRKHRDGWSVDRAIDIVKDCRALTWLDFPALFPTFETAANLVEAFFPKPPPGLEWSVR